MIWNVRCGIAVEVAAKVREKELVVESEETEEGGKLRSIVRRSLDVQHFDVVLLDVVVIAETGDEVEVDRSSIGEIRISGHREEKGG
jgi:phosphopantetheine adenylyltransferase